MENHRGSYRHLRMDHCAFSIVSIMESSIPEIKAQADIVTVISEFVILKHHGSRCYGLCPFHAETVGSFVVYATRQDFHCFGCGAHGNVLNFLQKYHGISLFDACKLINPDFKKNRRPQRPTAARSHQTLCQSMDIWKALYFDRMEPARRQKIMDYCLDNWQPWQRPEHFRLLFYRKFLRRMRKHPALMKAWKRNVKEYRMRKRLLYSYFR